MGYLTLRKSTLEFEYKKHFCLCVLVKNTNYGMQPLFLLFPLYLPETSQADSTTYFDNVLKLEA